MGLTFKDEDPDTVCRRFVREAAGLSFLSMHCNAPGEVRAVHPNDASWRIAEYEWARAGATGFPSRRAPVGLPASGHTVEMGRTERLDLAFTRTDSTDGVPGYHPDDELRLSRNSTSRSQGRPEPTR